MLDPKLIVHRIKDDLYGDDHHPDFLLALEDEIVDEAELLLQKHGRFHQYLVENGCL